MNFTLNDWYAVRDASEKQKSLFCQILSNECRRAVLGKMAVDSAKLYSFSDMYTHCKQLMVSYGEIIRLYEQYNKDIVSPEVREILEGIITILVSRLREFEELANSLQDGANPITSEEQIIIAQAMDRLEEAIATKNNESFRELYDTYLQHMNLCQGQLNDLGNRKEVSLYMTLMEDELEILSTIIKIQVQALEQAADSSPNAANALEKMAVHKILTLMREAYQHFGRASTEFLDLKDIAFEAESYESFEPLLKTCQEKAQAAVDSELTEKLEQFKQEIEHEADSIFNRIKLDFYKTLYNFRKTVSTEMMLAEDMIRAFVTLREKWPSSENEIVQGIAETIDIKIDSLRESITQITGECAAMLEVFTSENPPPAEPEITAAREAAWQLWQDNPEEFDSTCQDMFIFAERRRHHEKSAERYQDKLEKKLAKFKREILLYEVSTYEEIIFYSVSRLRDTEFTQAATLADYTLELLTILLNKNNIDVIRPQPHDLFNPREHEVLMAESKEDFKKGEIVKLMNSGYRQRDTVLLRANVIAAR